jgi:hypothetical protein
MSFSFSCSGVMRLMVLGFFSGASQAHPTPISAKFQEQSAGLFQKRFPTGRWGGKEGQRDAGAP